MDASAGKLTLCVGEKLDELADAIGLVFVENIQGPVADVLFQVSKLSING